jgi:hypothetical protein
MEYKVYPHVLRGPDGDVAIARIDGVNTLLVPVSEEIGRGVARTIGEGIEPEPVTIEEIEELCAAYELGVVGLFGLDDGEGLDVLAVETLGLVLER